MMSFLKDYFMVFLFVRNFTLKNTQRVFSIREKLTFESNGRLIHESKSH